MKNKSQHPIQPLILDENGIIRFKSNKIIRLLLDDGKYDMNRLALIDFSKEDREQFAQLIGYSVCEFSELYYVRNKTMKKVNKLEHELIID